MVADSNRLTDLVSSLLRGDAHVSEAFGHAQPEEPYVAALRWYEEQPAESQRQFERAVLRCLAESVASVSPQSEASAQGYRHQLLMLARSLTPSPSHRLELIDFGMAAVARSASTGELQLQYDGLQLLLGLRYRGTPDYWRSLVHLHDVAIASAALLGLCATGTGNLLGWLRTHDVTPHVVDAMCNILPGIYEAHGHDTSARIALLLLTRSAARDRTRLLDICTALELQPSSTGREQLVEEVSIYLQQILDAGTGTTRTQRDIQLEVREVQRALKRLDRIDVVSQAIDQIALRWKSTASESAEYSTRLLELIALSPTPVGFGVVAAIATQASADTAPDSYQAQRHRLLGIVLTVLQEVRVKHLMLGASTSAFRAVAAKIARTACQDQLLARDAMLAMPSIVSVEEFVANSLAVLQRNYLEVEDWVHIVETEFDRADSKVVALRVMEALSGPSSQSLSARLRRVLTQRDLITGAGSARVTTSGRHTLQRQELESLIEKLAEEEPDNG